MCVMENIGSVFDSTVDILDNLAFLTRVQLTQSQHLFSQEVQVSCLPTGHVFSYKILHLQVHVVSLVEE